MKRYFKVNAKCGHVGRRRFINIDFPVVASNAKEAAARARRFGRVKHHWKDAINSVEEISEFEFNKLQEEWRSDPYLDCRNVQEQRKICDLYLRVNCYEFEDEKKDRCVEYKMKKQKILERTIKLHIKEFAI